MKFQFYLFIFFDNRIFSFAKLFLDSDLVPPPAPFSLDGDFQASKHVFVEYIF